METSSSSTGSLSQNIYKILLLGDSNVGKTSIVQRFCDDSYVDGYISTIGIDFKQKLIKLHSIDDQRNQDEHNGDYDCADDDNNHSHNSINDNNQNNLIKLQLWDTAGQERFRALTTAYYRGAMAIIVVFDVANLESFQHVQYWFKNIDENASPQVIKILAANKCDRDQNDRIVDGELARQLAAKLNVPYYECSCKHNLNIQNMFMDLCKMIRKQLEQNENLFEYDYCNGINLREHLEYHRQSRNSLINLHSINSNNNNGDNNKSLNHQSSSLDDGHHHNQYGYNGNNDFVNTTMNTCTNCFTNYYYNFNF